MSNVYYENFEDALPDSARVTEEKRKLEDAGVKYILSCWIDMFGVPKTKPVPISDFELLFMGKGPQFAVHSISFVPELGPADADQVPLPDIDTIVICPWNETIAWVFADLWWEGKPYNLCPRQALKKQIRDAADQGYAMYAGVEPEFIAMQWDEAGKPVKAFDDDPQPGQGIRPRRQAFGYDVEYSLDSMGFLGDMIDILEGLGWNIHDVVAEGAYSQFELDFHYTDVLEMADRLVFLRVLLKEIAKKHDMFITFMPKPTTGDWRSGAHMNTSMQRVDNPGVNIYEGENGQWSEQVFHALGGILKHGNAITAIACSTVNSYNGLVPKVGGFEGGTYTWAPTHMAYGKNNRSAMLRLPQSRFAIENRAADMCMNPYLGLGMMLAASVDGLVNKIDPGPSLDEDLYVMNDEEKAKRSVAPLPRNLLEATEKLAQSELAEKVMGPVLLKSFLGYKVDEWERYHQTVTDWEVQEYLRLY
ncbi:MAG: glutamine synthetase [Gammaproteobacteria bacterium]|nr:glutamine synthetase [Gammaproteobacteria bacterium]NKB65213.1 glutamine synthetase [Gammaproteobacteria bacterium]